MLKQRITTALILAPLALAAIFLLPLQWYALAIAGVFILATKEWAVLVDKNNSKLPNALIVGYSLILGASLLVIPPDVRNIWEVTNGEIVLVPLVKGILTVGAVWWLICAALVLTYPNSAKIWTKNTLVKVVFGIVTLVPFFWAMLALRSYDYAHDQMSGAWLVMLVMFLVWGADSGAYFTGKKFGKNKLAPKVSPGKTREGFLGGVAVSMIIALIAAVVMTVSPSGELDSTKLVVVLFTCFVTSISSTLGDLNESMFKREAGVKDSGTLLPGHGGILDRIDSLTAALPVFAVIYLVWL
ncbi:Phosphatidate cytidylyltransferase [Moritella sp. JT01]|uniref:CDP-archaeol synthase n=1 Tax=Moritella sp. JT01 TaxID=756698 RepID=UPI000795A800|nr:CDP-archaeol synthase [Moritella sp. JT01]KXO11934.1 Phosphatidate cytidylyltransferase [Moritella sp. JT01]